MARIAASTYELSEFLVERARRDRRGRVLPAPGPHLPPDLPLLRGFLRVDDKRPAAPAPRGAGHRPGRTAQAEQCCGFGGTFALKNSDTSTAMLADKMASVLGTGAEVLTAGDSSCLMHIGGGLSRLRAGARTVHLAEILAAGEAGTSTSAPAGSARGAR